MTELLDQIDNSQTLTINSLAKGEVKDFLFTTPDESVYRCSVRIGDEDIAVVTITNNGLSETIFVEPHSPNNFNKSIKLINTFGLSGTFMLIPGETLYINLQPITHLLAA